jgi:hypothetical protein
MSSVSTAGGFCLKWVDKRMQKTELFYIRFMDEYTLLNITVSAILNSHGNPFGIPDCK